MRLMLEDAAQRGMAEAYYRENPKQRNRMDEEEAALQAAADVITTMMEEGRGDEVLKFSAYIAVKDEDRKPRGNTLAEALSRLPCCENVDISKLPQLPQFNHEKDHPPPPAEDTPVISIGGRGKF